jgi:hypothetical protein
VGLKEDRWTVHAHIAVVGAQPTSIGNLRNFYKGAEVKRPLVVQKLNDPVKQLSYLLKFHSYHRPTKGGQAYPLKPEDALELIQWQSQHCFEDFLFLKGLRRRGAHLKLT